MAGFGVNVGIYVGGLSYHAPHCSFAQYSKSSLAAFAIADTTTFTTHCDADGQYGCDDFLATDGLGYGVATFDGIDCPLDVVYTRIWLLQMALPPHSTLFTRIKHILNLILWGYFLLRLSGYDAVIGKALESVQFNFGSFKLNMLMIVLAIFWLTIFGIIMMWLNRTATHKVMGITSLDPNLRMMLSKIVTGLIVFLSVIIALPTIGIHYRY